MEPTVSVWPVTTIRTMPLVRAVCTACWTTCCASAVRFDLSKSTKTMKVRTAGGGGGGGRGSGGGGAGTGGGGGDCRNHLMLSRILCEFASPYCTVPAALVGGELKACVVLAVDT